MLLLPDRSYTSRPCPCAPLTYVYFLRQFCVFRYSELGLGLELGSEILRSAETMDLLISFLYTATHGGRVSLLYPTAVKTDQADGSMRTFIRLTSGRGNASSSSAAESAFVS